MFSGWDQNMYAVVGSDIYGWGWDYFAIGSGVEYTSEIHTPIAVKW
jgi:hypothetical protein